MARISIEDPIKRYVSEKDLPPGNPSGLVVGDMVAPIGNLAHEGGTILRMDARFVLRAITPTPTIYVGTIEPMGTTGTTGEYFDVKLPLLVKIAD